MRPILTILAAMIAAPAAAHPGHLAGLAGHDHWVAGAAIAVGLALAAWGGLRPRRTEDEADDGADAGAEPAEA